MLKFNIDNIIFKDGRLFAYGWGFVPNETILGVQLLITPKDSSDSNRIVDVDYGRKREDLELAFPKNLEAANSGFLIMVGGLTSANIQKASLIWQLADRTIESEISIPDHVKNNKVDKLNLYKIYILRSIQIIKESGFKSLIKKLIAFLKHRPSTYNQEIISGINNKNITLIIDHDLGGGANLFRNNLIKESLEKKETPILISFHVPTLQYFIEIFDDENSHRMFIDSLYSISSIFSNSAIKRTIYNCAVSFNDPLNVVDLLLTLKKTSNCALIVMVHDYFMICPSHFLLDKNGQFCDIPDLKTCNNCLEQHTDGFVSMTGERNISNWRQQWTSLLSVADEVNLFSQSSKNLLSKAYPIAKQQQWKLTPHKLHTVMPVVELTAGDCLHIGVIGAIGRHKGAGIINQLVEEILKNQLKIKITIIGTLESKIKGSCLNITGAYKPENLPQIVKSSGINIFLFPSIVSETFSYVSHELIAMEAPFACLNLGAPADLARHYSKGLVLSSPQPLNILKELQDFWLKTYYQQENSK